ncbi:olfactory receptor 14J1-like [Cinclus cinclus]|uniref:olfactory receptor 14J1-like n=1 Tax=Cinclus cinclus TaxID=127875 RepID=UPI002E0E1AE9
MMHIKAHQKVSSELEEGNELEDREAKEAAKGAVATEGALIANGQISLEGWPEAFPTRIAKAPEVTKTPMFFFLLNLALTDLGSICTTVPKAMHNSLWHTNNISYSACAAQLFFFVFFLSAEISLLTIMSYDRYVSICKPLHYGTLLGSRACAHMAAAAWASSFLNALLHTANTFSLPLCHGNALGQFFCEIPQILKLSCSHSYLRELGLIGLSGCLALGCFVFIVFSYVQIFRAVLRIPSEQGRHKAFSTCLPHLAVVSLFLSTVLSAYLKPPSISSPSLDLALSVLYSVVPPALNPLIYSLRNQELKLGGLLGVVKGCGQWGLVKGEWSVDVVIGVWSVSVDIGFLIWVCSGDGTPAEEGEREELPTAEICGGLDLVNGKTCWGSLEIEDSYKKKKRLEIWERDFPQQKEKGLRAMHWTQP